MTEQEQNPHPVRDIYQHVTDRIIEALESASHGEWKMPWNKISNGNTKGFAIMPCNISGVGYRGINVWLLMSEKLIHGYASDTWGTYKAWNAAGAQVRKGEKSATVIFWKQMVIRETSDTGEIKSKQIFMARGYAVFNADQVDNWQPKQKPQLPLAARIAAADAFYAAVPAEVRHGGNRAYYSPSGDYIGLPEFSQFHNAQAYYATRGHETVHFTGHASRCDRNMTTRFGEDAYAFEELIAELGAAYLSAVLDIDNEPRADHAAYLAIWLRRLRQDKRAIFTAASKAQAAVDWITKAALPA